MKTANILKLLCVVSMFYISCSKMEGPDYCGDDAVYVFKLRDTSYINYILVEYDKESDEIRSSIFTNDGSVAAPVIDKRDLVSLSNQYFFSRAFGNPFFYSNNAYTDITKEEALTFWDDPLIRENLYDTIKSRIVDTDPIEAMYRIHESVELFFDFVEHENGTYGIMFNEAVANEMIESGEFFTYEGVERIK